MLETFGLTAFYGDFQALFGVSVKLGAGETVAIIGANGAGKTTLMRSVAGALRNAPEQIRYKGEPIGDLPAEAIMKRGIAMTPEGRRIFPSLSVEENLIIGGQHKRKRNFLDWLGGFASRSARPALAERFPPTPFAAARRTEDSRSAQAETATPAAQSAAGESLAPSPPESFGPGASASAQAETSGSAQAEDFSSVRTGDSRSVRAETEAGERANEDGGGEGYWNLDTVYELFPILKERRRHSGVELSGGQQQMLAIGRALMSNPEALLCDEISLGLAPVVVRDVYAALPKIRENGASVILVEQDIGQAMAVADRVYCMMEGRITLEGKPGELDRERIQAAYFGVAS